MEPLPDTWTDIQPDTVYVSISGLLVSFASEQIQIGLKYDQKGKHLKAIEKGQVPLRGNVGLVASQESGYDLKSKVLGKGGDRRFHAKFIDGILHFPGLVTEH
ncbi:hypothetical protein ACN23B_09115 [Anabaena sp. FACHB-709]|uniref:Uncharacterized protein n=2 Tax=Nostocaceae TaxID=1162 RepID=A0A1Z4KEM6_ANAVA|nr:MULTISPECIES: hypothetical protein [Nostocaceae]BAY67446.1 hypothetical protein NIES23_02190 [Trichormus variabilis NIES-23]HBW30930.1 hypothetical protein [Nostoc sp. UBA8866]MBD2173386.1 hypothetical protein [Anabaena cylindrica FACHB-318]MBD2265136.1 hypothetical protein [Anabaena sp. FACHB-709]MBD2274447.1 hypothetical protein [Nostoc sp. PCC 7120 = FACHB-418]